MYAVYGDREGAVKRVTGPDDAISIEDFEFDATNLEHMARHGLDPNIVWDVWGDTPILLDRIGRSGTHLMIGETSSRRLWTVAVLLVDPELNVWRPITGWPSTRKEASTWRGES